MKIKHNLVFIPILIILAAGVWFMTRSDVKEEVAKRLSDRALVDFNALDVIEIISPDYQLRLEKIGDSGVDGPGTSENWRVVEPFESGCDPVALAGFLEAVKAAEAERDIPNVTSDQMAEYGLDQPSLHVILASASEGKTMMDLSFGKENMSGTSRYGMFANSQAAFLVPIYNAREFEITPEKIRDPRVIVFDRNNLVSIQLSSAQDEIVFENQETVWHVTSPREFPAKPARMEILLHDLEELRTVEFLELGFDDPRLQTRTAEVALAGSDGTSMDLVLYGEDISRGYFASSSYQPTLFIVESYIGGRLALSSEVFFHIQMISIPPPKIHRILVREPGSENIEIQRTGPGETDWKLLRPEGKEISDYAVFSDFVNAVFTLQPSVIFDDPGLPSSYGLSPTFFMKVEAVNEDGSEASFIKIGNRDENGNYFGTHDDKTYFIIDSAVVQNFIAAADRLR